MASVRRSARLRASNAAGGAADGTATAEAVVKPGVSRKRKTTAAATAPPRPAKEETKEEEERPSARPLTPPPQKKRRGRSTAADATAAVGRATATTHDPVAPPPATPEIPKTPATPKPRHTAVARLAHADMTHAPLISPETSRVVTVTVTARPHSHLLNGPSAARGTTTMAATATTSILDNACAHLVRVEPRLRSLIEAHYCEVFSPAALAEQVDPFESLASGIISQQVSGAAARSIKARFVGLFESETAAEQEQEQEQEKEREKEQEQEQEKEREKEQEKEQEQDKKQPQGSGSTGPRFPRPSQVAAMPVDRLRSAGLSQRKAEYLRGLADKFVSGELSARMLAEAPYDELVERLVAVRGLGLWSVEMFALFALKRLDVFSVGDLGVQRGMAAFAGRDIAKLRRSASSNSGSPASAKKKAKWKYMTDREMVAMAEPFRPYRSVFMWYMWRVESVDISTLG